MFRLVKTWTKISCFNYPSIYLSDNIFYSSSSGKKLLTFLQCIYFADTDECAEGDCGPHSTCINSYGSFSCECEAGTFLFSQFIQTLSDRAFSHCHVALILSEEQMHINFIFCFIILHFEDIISI